MTIDKITYIIIHYYYTLCVVQAGKSLSLHTLNSVKWSGYNNNGKAYHCQLHGPILG